MYLSIFAMQPMATPSFAELGPGRSASVSRDGISAKNMRAPHEDRMTIATADGWLPGPTASASSLNFDMIRQSQLVPRGPSRRTIVRLFGKRHDDAACIALKPFR